MKKLSTILIAAGALAALIAGICRLWTAWIVGAKAWAGIAVILLLIAIARNTLPKE